MYDAWSGAAAGRHILCRWDARISWEKKERWRCAGGAEKFEIISQFNLPKGPEAPRVGASGDSRRPSLSAAQRLALRA